MTNHEPTPYDTGARLEPLVWVRDGITGNESPRPAAADDYGRVDFEDDSSCTIATAYIAREGESHVLHVDSLSDPLAVATDHGRVLVLDGDTVAGLEELLRLAERGRADFKHQASYGDYSAEDRADADRRWASARAVAEMLHPHLTK
ncbi:hypothetical protein ACQ3HE_19215 [Plantibacter auratus]|uniref:hypothetical protein n=1 Tax=Plantibacter auratus TaxID=272914 RepID=UPI003D333E60